MTATDDTATAPAPEPGRGTAVHRSGLLSAAGPRLAALLLGVVCVAWSAAPRANPVSDCSSASTIR